MAFFEPLSFFMVLVAISLDWLGNTAVYLLDLPEWRVPREYIRSEYEPCEFCSYLVRWALDSRDTTFVFGTLLCLLLALGYWFYRQYQAGDDTAEHLKSIFEKADKSLQNLGNTAVDAIGNLQNHSNKLETRHQDDQEMMTQLQTRHLTDQERIAHVEDANNTLQTQNSELQTRLNDQQQAISSTESVNTALQGQIDGLETSLNTEQKARQHAADKASNDAKVANDRIERQAEEIVTLRQEIEAQRQRAAKAEQALREKSNSIKAAEQQQQQQERRFQLANERIEQLEEEAKQHKSEQEVLQDELEKVEPKEHASKSKLEAAEYQKELAAASQEPKALEAKYKALIDDYKVLDDDNTTYKERCAALEQEIKAIISAKKQQQEASPTPIEINKKLERKLNEATERINKLDKERDSDRNSLQEQLKRARSEGQRLNEELRATKLGNEKSTEKHNQATVQQRDKLQREHQLKQKLQQDELDNAHSKTQKVQDILKDCQQALKTITEAKEKQSIEHSLALEAKEKERKEVFHLKDARIGKLEASMRDATERIADHDNEMAQTQAELKTLQDDLELKSSMIESLQSELELASVEVHEAKGIMCLLESKKWHEYAKQQEAWILESYAIIQDNLEQAESHIQILEVALDGLKGEHECALETALRANDAKHAEIVSSQGAKIVELQGSIAQAQGSSLQRDKEVENVQAGLEAAETTLQDLKEPLLQAPLERDELRQQRSANVDGHNDVETTEAASSDTLGDGQLAAELTDDEEFAMKVGLEEMQAAAAAEESQSNQSNDEELDDDDGAGEPNFDHNACTSHQSLHNDGENDSWNDDSGNLDESTLEGKKKRRPNRRSKTTKLTTASTRDEPIDMSSTEVQQLIVTSQAEAMVASHTNGCSPQLEAETTVARVRLPPVSNNSGPIQPAQPQIRGLVGSQHEPSDQPLQTNICSTQPEAETTIARVRHPPVSNHSEPIRPPQQQIRGLAGSQHEPSGQSLRPHPQQPRRLLGSQHEPSGQSLRPRPQHPRRPLASQHEPSDRPFQPRRRQTYGRRESWHQGPARRRNPGTEQGRERFGRGGGMN